jgi:quercetin dioxygenase-like cupin family protein
MAAHEGAAGDKSGNRFSNDSDTTSPLRPQVTARSLVEVLRAIWWGQIREGHRMPAEHGVIVIDGGKL